MLDVQLLRARLDFVAERLATRGMSLDVAAFQALEDERKPRPDGHSQHAPYQSRLGSSVLSNWVHSAAALSRRQRQSST